MSLAKEKFTKDGVLLNGFNRVRSKKTNLVGTFKNGKLNGRVKGTYKYGKGKKWYCDGMWKNNKLEGRGKCTFSSKNIYDGIWKNDELVKGKMILPYYSKTTKKMQKQIQIGTFKNSKLNGKCIIKARNGIIYKGLCKNDNFHGKGTYNYEGKIYRGIWSGTHSKMKLNGSRRWDHSKN